jgi:hypothetical protein
VIQKTAGKSEAQRMMMVRISATLPSKVGKSMIRRYGAALSSGGCQAISTGSPTCRMVMSLPKALATMLSENSSESWPEA